MLAFAFGDEIATGSLTCWRSRERQEEPVMVPYIDTLYGFSKRSSCRVDVCNSALLQPSCAQPSMGSSCKQPLRMAAVSRPGPSVPTGLKPANTELRTGFDNLALGDER